VSKRPLSGEPAESHVANVLEGAGWTILDRRLRLGALELDLVAKRGDVVAIVEVRGRRAGGWVSGFGSISESKRARLVRATKRLWESRFVNDPTVRVLRIDVASVTWGESGPRVEIAEGAIQVD